MAISRHSQKKDAPNRDKALQSSTAALVEALTELYELLEQYAPMWYTKKHHDKALAALRSAKKKPRSHR